MTLKQLQRRFDQWLDCKRQRCDYYLHYLAYGPPDMPHQTFHFVAEQADAHFKHCTYNDHPRYRDGFTPDGKLDICRVCISFEKRLRA